jgi:CubicO group peptidase (beta-lactamase class C family)
LTVVRAALLVLPFSFVALFSLAQNPKELPTRVAIARLEKEIPDLLKKADIPGISIALVRNGQIAWSGVFGSMNAATKKPVTSETVFEAASLSKPVFAYGVLKLVDEGKLDLDTPLNKYLGNNYDVVDDPRINLITARHILSHTSGFPNWRDNDHTKNLLIHFTPGDKWSYSGEGMVYLSKVIEKITGLSLEDFMQLMVLQPLGMTSSSYIWQDKYDTLKAFRHDNFGDTTGRWRPTVGNPAASLTTNAVDYSRFIIAVLNGTGLKKETWRQMIRPQIRVTDKYPEIAWGLGIGLETMTEGTYLWHWGDNGDGKAWFTAFLPHKDAIIYFANSANGLSIAGDILADGIGGDHPALVNLAYEKYNSPAKLLLKAILTDGAAKAIEAYRSGRAKDTTKKIAELAMNDIGYSLMRIKRLDDAIEVFRQNTIDFPDSYNVWDSFAEANMNKGNKELAIKYYRKTLELNPGSENAKAQLDHLTDTTTPSTKPITP